MIKKFFLTLILICATVLTFAQGTINIYVSPDGTGDGTTEATPTTLTAALETFRTAAVGSETTYDVLLANGTYTGTYGVAQHANKNIVIEALDEANPACIMEEVAITVDGNGRSTANEYVTFKNLTFEGGNYVISNGQVDYHSTNNTYGHHITIESCSFTNCNVPYNVPQKHQSYNFSMLNCTFTNCGYAITCGSAIKYCSISNCTLTNCSHGFNLVHSTYVTFSNVTMTGITAYGIRHGQGSGTPVHDEATDVHLINCSISGTPGEGDALIVLRGDCEDFVIENTTLNATGDNNAALSIRDGGNVIVAATDTLTMTGTVQGTGTITAAAPTSVLVMNAGSTYGTLGAGDYVWNEVMGTWSLPPFTEVYVSPDGTGNGLTPEHPTTIQNAFNMIRNAIVTEATDFTVFMANGDYTGANVEISQAINKNIELRAMNPASASCNMALNFVIDGNGRSTGAETVTLKHLTLSGAYQIMGGVVADGLGTDLAHCYPHNITIDSCTFTNTTDNFAIQFPSSCALFDFVLTNSTFNGCSHCVQTAGGAEGMTIDKCTFTDCERGFNLNHARDITISNTNMTGFTKYAVRSGQGSGTPVHGETSALRLSNCTISGEPLSGEDLLVLRGDCVDLIADHVTVTATGANPSAFNIRAGSNVYVTDDTLAITGTITGDGTINGTSGASTLILGAGTTYGTTMSEGNYRWNVNLGKWIVPDSWYYIGEAQPALVFDGDDVCEISTPEQLGRLTYEAAQSTAEYSEMTIKLTADIDLAGHEWCPIGIGDGFFDGVFDGQGHTISNMTITDANPHLSYWDNALFGYLWFAEIENLKLADVNVYITRAAAASAPTGAAAGGIAGTSVASYFENIEITSGEIHSEYGTCATGGINYLTTYAHYPTYLYNVINRAKISGHICSPNANFFLLGGLVGHAANDLGFTAGDDDLIIFEKCANYGEIATANPYQMLADNEIADGSKFSYTIAGQLVAQSDYSAKTYLVFDSCVAGGTLYGSPCLRNDAGTLTEIASGVFQGQKWTGLTTSEPYGYTYDHNGAQNDYRIGQEIVFFTDKNADEIYYAINDDGEFTTTNHEYFSGSRKPANEAEKAAYAATKAFVSNSTGGQKFIFRGAAIANNTFYTTVDSAAKVGLPGTIYLLDDYEIEGTLSWNGGDSIQTIRGVEIVVPANATLFVNGELTLGTNARCVGTDNTSHLVITGTSNVPADEKTGIYVWNATENKWDLVSD